MLASLAEPAGDHRVAGVLATDDVIALTVGLWRPQVFVSQGFLERVDLSQQAVVLAHEQAHVRRRDPLMRWLLACLCSHLPWRLTAGLRQQFHLATEQLADQAAVRTAPATDIAATLVAVARLQRQRIPSGHTGFSAGFVSRQELPQRVDALLHPMPTHGLRFVYAALVLAVLMVAVMLMLDPLHHQLDFLLAH